MPFKQKIVNTSAKPFIGLSPLAHHAAQCAVLHGYSLCFYSAPKAFIK